MTTSNKLYSRVMALIVLGGCILNFGFVPVVVIGSLALIPLCWWLIYKNIKTISPEEYRKVVLKKLDDDGDHLSIWS